ncbi:uncharacterized protein Pyn_27377 [Prunus yedoensis var. nudiflora]|uniref:Uncharacterized protein n=1 Tax=Prunus yedoensis var. nudiflora TaxID=2094558 RepID=A0A314YSD4_PRUYE|nr:uncharacterized protein Pyn_27377 [Prunus yedoensis var. nudiflora]
MNLIVVHGCFQGWQANVEKWNREGIKPPIVESGMDPLDSSSLGYISWLGNKNTDCSVPASLSKLWENSNGTGVFIPQAVNPRSNYKPRRMNNNTRIYKRVQSKQ